jgi:light-harvesting complex 1 beta chain
MASIDPALGAAQYEIDDDQVPEVYRPFFNNADWTIHRFVVYGSWAFFIVAVVAHIFVWMWRPW